MSERYPRSILLNEGKTKRIWSAPAANEVLIESKDDITAGDGERRDAIDGKGSLATQTTANCFRLLNRAGIPNHFLEQIDDRTFRAQEVMMIPIELVSRRVAYGSYLKRNPNVESQTRFDTPVTEFFDKDDGMHDPLLLVDPIGGFVIRHSASKPIGEGYIDSTPLSAAERLAIHKWGELNALVRDTFEVLEAAWADQGVVLVDMKIECGMTHEGELVVADVIDNDSWRIWPNGDPGQMRDKQLYRDGKSLDFVRDKYAWVAQATNAFATDQ